MKKSFIPLTALALLALVSCGGNNNTSSESTVSSSDSVTPSSSAAVSSETVSSSEAAVYNSVTIGKKDELTAEWHVGDADRTLDITIDPVGNVNNLIKNGVIKVTSSDDKVISVKLRVLTAVSAGKATITVTYGDKTDSVTITTSAKQTAIVEYGTVHEGTETDPLDNEDAITVAEKTGETATTKYYYVKGVVASFKDAPSSYGNVSYYLEPKTKDGKKFLVYRVKGIDGADVTDDDIWVGATVTAKVKIVNYKGNTPETEQGGNLTKVEGTKTVVETINATVAEALDACKALDANSTSTSKYAITGYIVATDSQGFYLSDTKGKITPTKDDFLVYGWKGDTAEKCTLNAKVKVTATLKYYKSTTTEGVYNYETSKIDSVEILEEGDAPVEIEKITVASAIEKVNALEAGASSEVAYDITGYVTAVNEAYSSQYKNMTITIADTADGTDTLYVYRVKLGDSVTSDKIVAGAQITIRGYLQKFVTNNDDGTSTTTLQVKSGAEITAIVKEAPKEEAKTINATVAEAVTAAKALKSGSTSTDDYVITGYVTTVSGAWTSQYGNMSFYMSDVLDDHDAEFIAWQVKCTEEVSKTIVSGAKVKVSGKITNFSGTPETVAKGAATVELVEAPKGADVVASIAEPNIAIGATSAITVTAQEGVTFTYASSDNDIATVDVNGVVTGVASGEAYITITASTGRKAYIDVNVAAADEKQITWTASDADASTGLPEDYSSEETEFKAKFGETTITMAGKQIKFNSYTGTESVMLKSKDGDAYVYSKDAMPGVIKSIKIKTGAGAAAKAKYHVSFGTSALSTKTTEAGINVGKGLEHTWTCDVTDATYFQIASTDGSNNGQLGAVTVTYKVAA